MNIDDVFPLKLMINLSRREDRRFRMDLEFFKLGLQVERLQAVNKKLVKHPRGYPTAGRYACALSCRLVIRQAKLSGASAVLLFEDDVVFRPDFAARLEEIELPDDWGIFYLGCRHWKRPEPAGRGLVRVRQAMDTHALGFRAEYYDMVMRALGKPWNGDLFVRSVPDWGHDFILADLQQRIPTYACWPNLAWQEGDHSDLLGWSFTAYNEWGDQRDKHHAIAGLDLEMARIGAEAMDRLDPKAAPLRLHLGCGEEALEGWENLDLPEVDIREPLRYACGSVQSIFLEHVRACDAR